LKEVSAAKKKKMRPQSFPLERERGRRVGEVPRGKKYYLIDKASHSYLRKGERKGTEKSDAGSGVTGVYGGGVKDIWKAKNKVEGEKTLLRGGLYFQK